MLSSFDGVKSWHVVVEINRADESGDYHGNPKE
jgi:hypothetical protein